MDTQLGMIRRTSGWTRVNGFTLIELLVVMAIMAVLVAGIGMGLRGGAHAARLRGGEATLRAYLHSARSQAILRRRTVRLLVRNDPVNRALHRRQLGIVSRSMEGDDHWIAIDEGVLLPEGIYFWEVDPFEDWAIGGTVRLEYPHSRDIMAGLGSEWWYLEFLSNGSAAKPGVLELVVGRWEPEMNEPVLFDEDRDLRRRLGLSRFGAIMDFHLKEEVSE